jgi:HPt (histidine-containing phosphotransfer) domain-containing protein
MVRLDRIQMSDNTIDQEEVIDPNAVERLRRLGGVVLIARMIDLFAGHAGPIVEQAQRDLQGGNFDGIHRAGHSLKSSAGNVGATQMGRIAAEIERLAPAKDGPMLEKLIAELRSAFDLAKARLEQIRSQH